MKSFFVSIIQAAEIARKIRDEERGGKARVLLIGKFLFEIFSLQYARIISKHIVQ